ncbi:hypothetical protein GZOEXZXM_CDS0174 [Salmonella phage SeKF_64]
MVAAVSFSGVSPPATIAACISGVALVVINGILVLPLVIKSCEGPERDGSGLLNALPEERTS